MAPARSFAVGASTVQQRVLIATQGSPFKDALVTGIVDHLKLKAAYANVIDVTALPTIREGDWSAIVVLHTWEIGKPPPDVLKFLQRTNDKAKVLVLSTSGSGQGKIQMTGVDAISSASVMSEVPQRLTSVITRLDAILNATTTPQ
jgi:hypothetical protein